MILRDADYEEQDGGGGSGSGGGSSDGGGGTEFSSTPQSKKGRLLDCSSFNVTTLWPEGTGNTGWGIRPSH
jgi:hypothetical protein